MTELKPCPFCGKEGCYVDEEGMASDLPTLDMACVDPRCMPPSSYIPAQTWQSRPVEDALSAENARLRSLLAALVAECEKSQGVHGRDYAARLKALDAALEAAKEALKEGKG